MKSNNSLRKVSYWTAIGTLSVITLFLWFLLGASLFGYRLVSIAGTSMEPDLSHGDALWTKNVDPAEIKVGDIVSIRHPTWGGLIHRVVGLQSPSEQVYLIETRGDANFCSETHEVFAGEKIRVSTAHIRRAGYALEFFGSIEGIVLLIGITTAAIAIYVKRRQRRTRY